MDPRRRDGRSAAAHAPQGLRDDQRGHARARRRAQARREGRRLTPLALLGLAGAFALAFANGANDISKSVATLSCCKEDADPALRGASLAVLLGACAALWWGAKMTLLFTKGMITTPDLLPAAFGPAVVAGAVVWLLLATRLGLPVSTTHAVVGGIVAVGAMTLGSAGVLWPAVASKVVTPLLLSPLCAAAAAVALAVPLRALSIARPGALRGLHWGSCFAGAFARGLNDTPKIAALGLACAAGKAAPWALFPALAVANAAGGWWLGRRVTETLGCRMASISEHDGAAANLTTSLLAGATAFHGFPVSTTHVSGSAIAALGAARGSMDWKVAGDIALAWLVTLPVAGALSALAYLAFSRLG
jgi:PiT family inorganic phosphate transporter